MTARIDLPSRRLPAMDRLARRSALLFTFQQILNGRPRGTNIAGTDPDSLPDAEVLGSLSRSQLVARPHRLRRLLAPLALARTGRAASWTPEFRELAIAAFSDKRPRPERFDDALEQLRICAQTRFAVEGRPASARDVRAGRRILDPEELLEVEPGRIENRDGVFKVSRSANVKAPLRAIRDAIDPVNWTSMGEAFEYVGRIEGKFRSRPDDGWYGLFEERFAEGWGPFRLGECHPTLLVDFTFDDTRVRADYSLVSEKDDVLECDDGFLEATPIAGRVGWCRYYAEKSTKFVSPATNLLAPTIAAVFLESNLSSIEDTAYDYLDLMEAGDRDE